jgi:hypothetical protein
MGYDVTIGSKRLSWNKACVEQKLEKLGSLSTGKKVRWIKRDLSVTTPGLVKRALYKILGRIAFLRRHLFKIDYKKSVQVLLQLKNAIEKVKNSEQKMVDSFNKAVECFKKINPKMNVSLIVKPDEIFSLQKALDKGIELNEEVNGFSINYQNAVKVSKRLCAGIEKIHSFPQTEEIKDLLKKMLKQKQLLDEREFEAIKESFDEIKAHYSSNAPSIFKSQEGIELWQTFYAGLNRSSALPDTNESRSLFEEMQKCKSQWDEREFTPIKRASERIKKMYRSIQDDKILDYEDILKDLRPIIRERLAWLALLPDSQQNMELRNELLKYKSLLYEKNILLISVKIEKIENEKIATEEEMELLSSQAQACLGLYCAMIKDKEKGHLGFLELSWLQECKEKAEKIVQKLNEIQNANNSSIAKIRTFVIEFLQPYFYGEKKRDVEIANHSQSFLEHLKQTDFYNSSLKEAAIHTYIIATFLFVNPIKVSRHPKQLPVGEQVHQKVEDIKEIMSSEYAGYLRMLKRSLKYEFEVKVANTQEMVDKAFNQFYNDIEFRRCFF